jgi:N-formylglutamate deformylase
METGYWLRVRRGNAPLVLSVPHAGTDLPEELEPRLVSAQLARRDADWWVDRLYDFADALGATTIQTTLSRTVIDVNRDPTGASLYPGQLTTELCPTTTFDGEPLYRDGAAPDAREIADRRERYYAPYHDAVVTEIERLHEQHPRVVLYDCHSIRSQVPRLFEGELPNFNIGTNSGRSCAGELANAVAAECAATRLPHVIDGRFKGGHITRHYGRPGTGVHALQMELACRGYMREVPGRVINDSWPTPYDPAFAAPMRATLTRVLHACLAFARGAKTSSPQAL